MVNIIHAPDTRTEYKKFIQDNAHMGIIVYASATWCKPCKTVKPYIETYFKSIKDETKILMMLDIDTSRDVANYLKIRGVPILTYYEDGMPTHVVNGGKITDINSFFQKIK